MAWAFKPMLATGSVGILKSKEVGMYAGNSAIVNVFMRWPVLVPLIAGAAAVLVVYDPAPLQPTTFPVVPVVEQVMPPVEEVIPQDPAIIPPLETICPPYKAKLSKKEKKALADMGCKVKG